MTHDDHDRDAAETAETVDPGAALDRDPDVRIRVDPGTHAAAIRRMAAAAFSGVFATMGADKRIRLWIDPHSSIPFDPGGTDLGGPDLGSPDLGSPDLGRADLAAPASAHERPTAISRPTLAQTLIGDIGPGRDGEIVAMAIDPGTGLLWVATHRTDSGYTRYRGELRQFDMVSGELLTAHLIPAPIRDMVIDPTGATLILLESNAIRLLDLYADEIDAVAGEPAARLSSDGYRIAAGATADGRTRVFVTSIHERDPFVFDFENGRLTELDQPESDLGPRSDPSPAPGLFRPDQIATSGELVAVANHDGGDLHILDMRGRIVGTVAGAGGGSPAELCFSPDGRHLAVGSKADDSAVVTIHRVHDDFREVSRRSFDAVAPAVTFLDDYTVGAAGGRRSSVRVWTIDDEAVRAGSTADRVVDGAGHVITAVGLTDRAVGIGLAPPARSGSARDDGGDGAGAGNGAGGLDGGDLSGHGMRYEFALDDLALRPVDGEDPDTAGSRYRRAVRVEDGRSLTVSPVDHNLILEPGYRAMTGHGEYGWDYAESYGLLPNEQVAVGGRSGTVRVLRWDGERLLGRKLIGHAGPVLDLVADDRWLVTGGRDQVVRFWSMADATRGLSEHHPTMEPTLNLFTTGREWVMWTRTGFFASSPEGDRLINFHANRGFGQRAWAFPADRFVDLLYRPDIVRAVLRTGSEQAALTELGVEPVRLSDRLPPVVQARYPQQIEPFRFSVAVTVRELSAPVSRVWALRDGMIDWEVEPAPVDASTVAAGSGSRPLEFQPTFWLDPGSNHIRVLAESSAGPEGTTRSIAADLVIEVDQDGHLRSLPDSLEVRLSPELAPIESIEIHPIEVIAESPVEAIELREEIVFDAPVEAIETIDDQPSGDWHSGDQPSGDQPNGDWQRDDSGLGDDAQRIENEPPIAGDGPPQPTDDQRRRELLARRRADAKAKARAEAELEADRRRENERDEEQGRRWRARMQREQEQVEAARTTRMRQAELRIDLDLPGDRQERRLRAQRDGVSVWSASVEADTSLSVRAVIPVSPGDREVRIVEEAGRSSGTVFTARIDPDPAPTEVPPPPPPTDPHRPDPHLPEPDSGLPGNRPGPIPDGRIEPGGGQPGGSQPGSGQPGGRGPDNSEPGAIGVANEFETGAKSGGDGPVRPSGRPRQVSPELFLLSVGVSTLAANVGGGPARPDGLADLRYAAADADALTTRFLATKGAHFGDVHNWLLTDAGATRSTIEAARDELVAAVGRREQHKRDNNQRASDVVMICFSGHGVAETQVGRSRDEFYLVTHEFVAGRAADTGLPFADLVKPLLDLRNIEIVVLIDACRSGFAGFGHLRQVDPNELAKRLRAPSEQAQHFLCSTSNSQLSYERRLRTKGASRAAGHGLFTHAIIERMATNRSLSVSSLAAGVEESLHQWTLLWDEDARQIPTQYLYGPRRYLKIYQRT